MKAILISLAMLAGVSTVLTQTTSQSTTCPRVSVSCESNCTEPPFVFKAAVADTETNQTIIYHWVVSGGQIAEGQGTPVIKVVDHKVRRVLKSAESPILYSFDNRQITARVELKGVPGICDRANASMSIIGEIMPLASPIADFGFTDFRATRKHLDRLVHWLQIYPSTTGSIVSSKKWTLAKRARDYLVRERRLDPGRVAYVQRQEKGPLQVILYVVPAGAIPPK